MKRFFAIFLMTFGGLLTMSGALLGAEFTRRSETILSGGVPVSIRRFDPAEPGRRPAVLLVQGLFSPSAAAPLMEVVASRFAQQGYAVFLVNYFERTGTSDAEIAALVTRFQTMQRDGRPDSEARRLFAAWLATLHDAVVYMRAQPNVDGTRVAAVGFSLGGYLSLALASEEQAGIRAVVDLFGGMPRELRDVATRLPPVLIVHGDSDRVVPVSEAQALRHLLEKEGVPHETLILKGVGHVFASQTGSIRWDAVLATDWTVGRFLAASFAREGVSVPNLAPSWAE